MITSNDVLVEVTDKLVEELKKDRIIYDSIHNVGMFKIRCIRNETSRRELYLYIHAEQIRVLEITNTSSTSFNVLNVFPLADIDFIDKLTAYIKKEI